LSSEVTRRNRQDLDDANDLAARVLELVVREEDAVDLVVHEVRDHAVRCFARL
jgi:hypothetical protein